MSSRWISMSLRSAASLSVSPVVCCRRTSAWAALTSELLPMPRAPHSSALLAGSPSAKRRVLSRRSVAVRSMPFSSDRGTRLTLLTGAKCPGILKFAGLCQTKASAASKSGGNGAGGAIRSITAVSRCTWSLRRFSCAAFLLISHLSPSGTPSGLQNFADLRLGCCCGQAIASEQGSIPENRGRRHFVSRV